MRRILVVDDDREVVLLIRAYLEQAGFEVLAAYDGDTAVHVIRRERPDLLLQKLFWICTALMIVAALLFSILSYFYRGKTFMQESES